MPFAPAPVNPGASGDTGGQSQQDGSGWGFGMGGGVQGPNGQQELNGTDQQPRVTPGVYGGPTSALGGHIGVQSGPGAPASGAPGPGGNVTGDPTTNGGNGAAGALGFEGSPGYAYFGGDPRAAANATNYYVGQANQAMQQAAPTIDNTGFNQTGQALQQNGIAAQQAAVNGLQQTANGQGPAQQAAAAQLRQGTDAAMNSNLSTAASARGESGVANAQKQALTQNGAQGQAAATQASLTRANMSAQAQGQLAGAAQGLSNTYLGEQGQQANNSQAQAALQEEQNKSNQAANLAYQQYGLNATQSDLGAQEFNVGIQSGINENNASNGANLTSAAMGAGALALAAFADVKMKEPGGKSGWTIREEPDFLLARNDRTGELRKLATEPLSSSEHRQAMAPHGAGPIGSPQSLGRTVGDLDVGDDMGSGGGIDWVTDPSDSSTPPGMLDNAANNTALEQSMYANSGAPVGSVSDSGAPLPVKQVDPSMGGTLGANAPANPNQPKMKKAFQGIGQSFMRPQVKGAQIGANGGTNMAQQVAKYGGA